MTTLGRERQMSRSSKEPVMLTVDIERASDVAIVRCAGRIVRGAEVSILRNAVVSEKDARTIVLDLSELEFVDAGGRDRKSTRLNSSHTVISYAVFCLKKKIN